MPAWVKKRDEGRWARAKEIALEQYGDPLRYGVAVHVFRGMHDQSSLPRRPAKDNPADAPAETDKALDNYRMWHKRAPDSEFPLNVKYPEHMAWMGQVEEVLYWSDKWKKPGAFELYNHKCDSHAAVYAPRKGGSVSTSVLLGVDDFRRPIPITQIGLMEEATWKRPDGRMQVKGFPAALLLATADLQALVIVPERGEPLIIRGGRMRVASEGIVH